MAIVFFIFLLFFHELSISYYSSKIYDESFNYSLGLVYEDWLIIANDNQRLNLVNDGYEIPENDFKNNFMILSKYKIKGVYYFNFCDKCTGLPDGIAIFDKNKSNKNEYYLYTMPPVWLSQAAG